MALTFIQDQLFEKSKTSGLIFLQIAESVVMKCGMLPQVLGLLKLMLNVFHTIDVQGR